MTSLPLIFAAVKRTAVPEAVTVNCLVEQDPTSTAEALTLRARPGTENFAQVGTAPIRALWQKDGLFNGSALVLANDTLYSLTSGALATAFAGAISGDDLVDVDGGLDADYNSIARIATGTALFKATLPGGTVVQEDFPTTGGAGATSVGFLSGYWLATEAGSDAVYYQLPAATTWNALQFASAEYAPDPNVCIRVVGEIAWLMGTTSLEGWRATGSSSSPLEPYGGLKFDVGCRTKSAAVNCRGTLIFVDNDCAVRLTTGGEPSIISDNGLSEQIRKSDALDLRASFVVKDQHPLYVLTLGTNATWIYDLSMKTWTRAKSQGYDFWRADLFCNIGDVALARDALSNQIYRLDPDRLQDAETTFTMEFTGYVETKELPVSVGNLQLHCEVGGAPLTGQGSDPLVAMHASYDGAKSFGELRTRKLGVTGASQQIVRWNGLGTTKPPFGMWFRFYISDPVVRRVSGGSVNAP